MPKVFTIKSTTNQTGSLFLAALHSAKPFQTRLQMAKIEITGSQIKLW